MIVLKISVRAVSIYGRDTLMIGSANRYPTRSYLEAYPTG